MLYFLSPQPLPIMSKHDRPSESKKRAKKRARKRERRAAWKKIQQAITSFFNPSSESTNLIPKKERVILPAHRRATFRLSAGSSGDCLRSKGGELILAQAAALEKEAVPPEDLDILRDLSCMD